MKSATRGRRTTASGFPDDDGFGSMWPDEASFGSAADPWTDPNAVAQAWPQQQQKGMESNNSKSRRGGRSSRRQQQLENIEWTATDLSGFPADPLATAVAWPEPQIAPQGQERHPQRMSDEDWLPATTTTTTAARPKMSAEAASTWGSVAHGRSEESDEWNTDPLSFSQDGISGNGQQQHHHHPPLGTEARPIPVEDLVDEEQVLDEREADLLIQAQRKRHNEAPSRGSQQRSTSNRKSPTQSRSPVPEELSEDISPRKGIMRFFGSGKKKKKGGSDAGSSTASSAYSPAVLGALKSARKLGNSPPAKARQEPTPAKQNRSPQIVIRPSQDQSTVSGVTNPTFVPREAQLDENAAKIMREQRERMLAQKRGQLVDQDPTNHNNARSNRHVGAFHARDPFTGSHNIGAAPSDSSSVTELYAPVTSRSDFGEPFFQGGSPPDIGNYTNEDPGLEHLMGDVSSTDSRREELENEEKKDDDDLRPIRETVRQPARDTYQPKFLHEYDLSAPPPPPPPPPPPRTSSVNRSSSLKRSSAQRKEKKSSSARTQQSPPKLLGGRYSPPPRSPTVPSGRRLMSSHMARSPSRAKSQPKQRSLSPAKMSTGTMNHSPPRAKSQQKNRSTSPQKLQMEPFQRLPPTLPTLESSRVESPDPIEVQKKVQRARSMFERRERQLSRTPPRSRELAGPNTSSPIRPSTKEAPGQYFGKGQFKPPANLQEAPQGKHNQPSPGVNTTPPKSRRRSFSTRRGESPVQNREGTKESHPAQDATRDIASVSSENSLIEPNSVTPGMAARLRDRQQRKRRSTDSDPTTSKVALPVRQQKPKSTVAVVSKQPELPTKTRGLPAKARQQPTRRGNRMSQAPSTRPGERILDSSRPPASVSNDLTPLQRRQARLTKQLSPDPDSLKKKKKQQKQSTKSRMPLQPAQSYEGLKPADSLGSVGNDINRLRAFRRSSGCHNVEKSIVSYANSADYYATTYDENDPMQRASLRLLSKQVVPIQCAARRFLALREAFTRMWAVIVIQSFARRFLVESSLTIENYSACLIQSVYRGGRVRDQVLLEHCCAVEIQRTVRGYLATLAVYEEIYQITLVQSIVRRKQAIDLATDRMVCIIQLQSLVRAFLFRKRMKEFHSAATVLQKTWRGSFQRLSYELDLLDIVIIQSSVRRILAVKRCTMLRDERNKDAATKIQAFWRCRSLRLAYQVDLFDIVVCQSAVRRALAVLTVRPIKDERDRLAATKIQTFWRGQSQRLLYQVDLFDIVLCQTVVRRMFAAKYVQGVRDERHRWAATKIQTTWRGLTQKLLYQMDVFDIVVCQCAVRRMFARRSADVLRYQRRDKAATKIQTAWRSLCQRLLYQMDLFDVVIVQSAVRRMLATKRTMLLREDRNRGAALKIQTFWRCSSQCLLYRATLFDIVTVQSIARRMFARTLARELQFAQEYHSATKIQSWWRSVFYRLSYRVDLFDVVIAQSAVRRRLAQKEVWRLRHAKEEASATKIQAIWRGTSNRLEYQLHLLDIVLVQSQIRVWFARNETQSRRLVQQNIAATKIQALWRCYDFSVIFRQYCAARKIQTAWRCYDLSNIYRQYVAARKIQAAWRRCSATAHYKLSLFGIITVQSMLRRRIAQRQYESIYEVRRKIAAKTIQKTWRWYSCFISYQIKIYSAITLQSLWRGKVTRNYYALLLESRRHVAATIIQAIWRCYAIRVVYLELIAAIKLQSAWRRHLCTGSYKQSRAAVAIQSSYRRHRMETFYLKYKAATRIQALWRSYDCTMNYLHYLADVLTVQSAVRAWIFRKRELKDATEASVLLQSVFRMHLTRTFLRKYFAARKIQSICRLYAVRSSLHRVKAASNQAHLEVYSATVVQKTWRGFAAYADYMFCIADIVLLQSVARRFFARKLRKRLVEESQRRSATKIQAITRSRHARKVLAATVIQANWRVFLAETEYFIDRFENRAATIIQTAWRGFLCFSKYVISLDSAIHIQASFRGYREFNNYATQLEAAEVIQTTYRNRLAVFQETNRAAVGYILSTSGSISEAERYGATQIQRTIRGINTRRAVRYFLMATKIQTAWRAFRPRNDYRRYIAAQRIQAVYKGWRVQRAYTLFIAARRIQAVSRGYRVHQAYKLFTAARKIQAIARGHRIRTAYILYGAARKIQSLARGHRVRIAFVYFVAARKIQAIARGRRTRQAYVLYMAARSIQSVWRCRRLSHSYKVYKSARKIQSTWRGYCCRKSYKIFRSARKIQSTWRMFLCISAFKMYLSARRIQTFWRSKSTAYAYKVYRSSCRIQATWKGSVVRKAYARYRAARCIQSNYRCVRARKNSRHLRQRLKEYCAAILIQACVRRKLARAAFVAYREVEMADEIKAAVIVQKMWRGFAIRNAGYCFTHWRYIGARRECSAVTIQKCWRGFSATETYWQTLGSIILIQSLARKWKEENKYNEVYEATIIAQSFARLVVAKLEIERRKFILSLVHTIQGRETFQDRHTVAKKKPAADVRKDWEKVLEQQQTLDRAARVIQRFFKMVKREVDLAIQAERKRRKKRKKKKQRKVGPSDEDALLENIWETIEDPTPNHDRGSSYKAKLPAEYALADRSSMDRTVDDDATSFVSASSVSRIPKSRMGLPTRTIDEEYALETAFMDAEIFLAKKRTHGLSIRREV